MGHGRERGRRKAGVKDQSSPHTLPWVRNRKDCFRLERVFEVQQPEASQLCPLTLCFQCLTALSNLHSFQPKRLQGIMVKNKDVVSYGCGLKCPIEDSLAVWSSVNVCSSLSPHFLICKMGAALSPTQQVSAGGLNGMAECSA